MGAFFDGGYVSSDSKGQGIYALVFLVSLAGLQDLVDPVLDGLGVMAGYLELVDAGGAVIPEALDDFLGQ